MHTEKNGQFFLKIFLTLLCNKKFREVGYVVVDNISFCDLF